jgi:excisionase family DNA binding protein
VIKCPDLPDKTLLRPDEVAEFFSVEVRTIYAWCDAGTLESIKINGTMRIYRRSVLKAIQAGDTALGPQEPQEKKRRVLSKGIQ